MGLEHLLPLLRCQLWKTQLDIASCDSGALPCQVATQPAQPPTQTQYCRVWQQGDDTQKTKAQPGGPETGAQQLWIQTLTPAGAD